MRLTREEKDILEAKIGKDYEEIVDFALKNDLDYDGALKVLAGEATLDSVKKALNEAIEEEEDEVPLDEILAACDACAKIAEEEKNKVAESLEEAAGYLDDKALYDYRNKISRIAHNQAVVQQNGLFTIYLVKENEAAQIKRLLEREDFIEYVRATPTGKYNFNNIDYRTNMPSKYYQIQGKIKF